jgi:hypothetical protein
MLTNRVDLTRDRAEDTDPRWSAKRHADRLRQQSERQLPDLHDERGRE